MGDKILSSIGVTQKSHPLKFSGVNGHIFPYYQKGFSKWRNLDREKIRTDKELAKLAFRIISPSNYGGVKNTK